MSQTRDNHSTPAPPLRLSSPSYYPLHFFLETYVTMYHTYFVYIIHNIVYVEDHHGIDLSLSSSVTDTTFYGTVPQVFV